MTFLLQTFGGLGVGGREKLRTVAPPPPPLLVKAGFVILALRGILDVVRSQPNDGR